MRQWQAGGGLRRLREKRPRPVSKIHLLAFEVSAQLAEVGNDQVRLAGFELRPAVVARQDRARPDPSPMGRLDVVLHVPHQQRSRRRQLMLRHQFPDF